MTLMQAQINKRYKINGVTGDTNARRRLLDMGFTPACVLHVLGIAPMGGTVLVGLRGFTVALREDAASLIQIEAA